MRNFFKRLFSKMSVSSESWTVDRSSITGKYQDLKHRFMQDHGSSFQIHFGETGAGINVMLFLADAPSHIELKNFIKIISDNKLQLGNVIYVRDNSGLNITLVCRA